MQGLALKIAINVSALTNEFAKLLELQQILTKLREVTPTLVLIVLNKEAELTAEDMRVAKWRFAVVEGKQLGCSEIDFVVVGPHC